MPHPLVCSTHCCVQGYNTYWCVQGYNTYWCVQGHITHWCVYRDTALIGVYRNAASIDAHRDAAHDAGAVNAARASRSGAAPGRDARRRSSQLDLGVRRDRFRACARHRQSGRSTPDASRWTRHAGYVTPTGHVTCHCRRPTGVATKPPTLTFVLIDTQTNRNTNSP